MNQINVLAIVGIIAAASLFAGMVVPVLAQPIMGGPAGGPTPGNVTSGAANATTAGNVTSGAPTATAPK